jgi:type I restriction enzyme, S subunit
VTVRMVRVGDVLELVREPVRIDPAKTYRQIGIYSFGKGIIRREPTPGAELSKLRYFKVPANALVLSNIQAWEGAIAVSSEDESGFVASSRFLSYLPIGRSVDVNYLRYFFLSDRGHPLIQQASPGTMVRNRTLGIEAFEGLRIPLPTLEEQYRIAVGLNAIFVKAETTNQHTRLQRQRVTALVDLMMREEESWTALGEVLDLDLSEEAVQPTSEYQLAGVYGFGRGLFERGPISGAETSYRRLYRLRTEQVVLSRLKAFEGAVAVVPKEFDGWVLSPEFPTFSPRFDRIGLEYLVMLCEWPGFWELLRDSSAGIGARRERISAQRFLSVAVPLPPLERQREIAATYAKLRQMRKLGEGRQTLLGSLQKSALNSAFAGL